MYTMFAKEDNADTTVTTMMNIAALTMGSTITATIPDLVANTINQLSANQNALMNHMGAMLLLFAKVPLPSNPCRRPSGPKTEIQHNQRGRGVPTLT
jgi:hypothetical protein